MSIRKFFSSLKKMTIEQLYTVYKPDFLMDGYNATAEHYISMGQE